MSVTMVDCPRCSVDPDDGTERTNTRGYIDWDDDATPEERTTWLQGNNGPDEDNEIPCPLCEGETTVDEQKAMEWARVPEPSNAPPAKFQLQWLDSGDAAHVIATATFTDDLGEAEQRTYTVGLLSFQGNGWDFVKIDHDGNQITDGVVHIDCEPGQEAAFRRMEEEARTNLNGAVLKAQLKVIETQRSMYCDETRELAELGARIEARRYWREYGGWLMD